MKKKVTIQKPKLQKTVSISIPEAVRPALQKRLQAVQISQSQLNEALLIVKATLGITANASLNISKWTLDIKEDKNDGIKK